MKFVLQCIRLKKTQNKKSKSSTVVYGIHNGFPSLNIEASSLPVWYEKVPTFLHKPRVFSLGVDLDVNLQTL